MEKQNFVRKKEENNTGFLFIFKPVPTSRFIWQLHYWKNKNLTI